VAVALSKRYVPCAAHWAAVLRAVHALAAVPVRDPICVPHAHASEDAAAAPPLPSLGAPPPGLELLSGGEAMAVRCLLLRASFGGMACDVAMLRAAAALWARRFAGAADAPPPLPARSGVAAAGSAAASQRDASAASDANCSAWSIYLESLFASLPRPEHCLGAADAAAELAALPPLRLRDVPPSAIDFHCSNILTDVLADAALPDAAMEALHAAGEPVETLKRAMWRYRSGVNTKTRLAALQRGGKAADGDAEDDEREEGDEALRAAWAGVAPLVELHSARFIRRNFF
jgi:hypothetical protein